MFYNFFSIVFSSYFEGVADGCLFVIRVILEFFYFIVIREWGSFLEY